MIVIIVGGIGSGKTLSVVKEIVDRQQLTFTNFNLSKIKHYSRLKYDQLFKKVENGKKVEIQLNYDYWNQLTKEHRGFDICLDEFHNLMSSRRAMSKRNVLLSDWLSQIRKILGQSENNNLYLITQKLRRIDVNSRDLCHYCILCQKVEFSEKIPTMVNEDGRYKTKMLPLTMIYKYFFNSPESLQYFQDTGQRTYYKMTKFVGNWYYRYFNSYELIDFGGTEYV